MKHSEAVVYLSDLAAGSLAADTAVAVNRHLNGCRRCEEWLSLYNLLEQHLSGSDTLGGPHPSSDLLALHGLRPEELSDARRRQIRRHLRVCPSCREELEISRQAVREARPGEESAMRRGQVPGLRRWLPLAAGLAALLICGAILFSAFSRVDRGFGRVITEEATPATSASFYAAELSVSDREFDGVEVVHADSSLRVTNSGVKPGAQVTFSSGGVVAFGDGFSVAEGGRITVTSRRAKEGPPAEVVEPR